MYKYAVFDLDGTLANTLEDLSNAVNYALKKNSFKTQNIDKFRQMVGSGIVNLIKMASNCEDEETVQKIKEDFYFYYNNHSTDCTREYNNGSKMLSELKKNNIEVAVLSNKPDIFVEKIINTLFPNIKFKAMWGKKEEFPIKPDPASLNAMIKEFGAEKSEVVYIGDSNVDVYTAKNTGVDFIGCAWGFRGSEELKQAGADIIAKDNIQLLNFILGVDYE